MKNMTDLDSTRTYEILNWKPAFSHMRTGKHSDMRTLLHAKKKCMGRVEFYTHRVG